MSANVDEPVKVPDPPKEVKAKKSIGVQGTLGLILGIYINLDDETRKIVHTAIINFWGSHERFTINFAIAVLLAACITNTIRMTWANETLRPTWASALLNFCDPLTLGFWRARFGALPGSAEMPKAKDP